MKANWVAAFVLALAACAAPEASAPSAALSPDAPPTQNPTERRAWFGDLHLHTTYSFDAYVMMGAMTTPEQAYRFARGETIDFLGQPVRRELPLDFMAVTDHAETLGVFNELEDPNSVLSRSQIGGRLRQARESGPLRPDAPQAERVPFIQGLLRGSANIPGVDSRPILASAWRREIDAANRYYEPGRFTTFIAYEWTSMPGGQNLHRNVIFRGDDAPAPFTANDSDHPEELWAYLTRVRAHGYEALAIAHNSNASNGLMYDWTTLDGRPIDAAYAQLRSENEALVEMAQHKGASETHPQLSPNDEFADFEIYDRLLAAGNQPSRPDGSYVRDALSRGLALQQRLGVNPYHDGFVGGTDLHGGLSVSAESNYGGDAARMNLGGVRPSSEQVQRLLAPDSGALISSAGALTGVWAEENTRESIYSALRRRETFATSGTRISVRFFGGWRLQPNLVRRDDWVALAYEQATPMGGDLVPLPGAGQSPSFIIWAQKDPGGANLDRAQIIKVWVDPDGSRHERIFDVAYQRGRGRDANGYLTPIGDTVDIATATYRNTIGSTQFLTVWRDPEFDPGQSSAYYLRVLEIPTPRWTTLLAAQAGVQAPEAHASIQERAWSSPIWYTPPR